MRKPYSSLGPRRLQTFWDRYAIRGAQGLLAVWFFGAAVWSGWVYAPTFWADQAWLAGVAIATFVGAAGLRGYLWRRRRTSRRIIGAGNQKDTVFPQRQADPLWLIN